jgi:hypothetical protein
MDNIFEFICENCYLFTWKNKACIVTKRQANLFAFDLFANGLINLDQFPK